MTIPSRTYTLAIPSKGSLHDSALAFFQKCLLVFQRDSQRQYAGTFRDLPGVRVLLLRPTDIVEKVEEGSVDMGITGADLFAEYGKDHGPAQVILPALGFGAARLEVGVPETWLHVSTVEDLADLALQMEREGRPLRVATSFPKLSRKFFQDQGIANFVPVESEGSVEIAPSSGFADCIVDLVSSGRTLRENHLKLLEDGTLFKSESCLIGRKALLDEGLFEASHPLFGVVDRMKSFLQAADLIEVSAVFPTEEEQAFWKRFWAVEALQALGTASLRSLQKPGSKVGEMEIRFICSRKQLHRVVGCLRELGASPIRVHSMELVFGG